MGSQYFQRMKYHSFIEYSAGILGGNTLSHILMFDQYLDWTGES